MIYLLLTIAFIVLVCLAWQYYQCQEKGKLLGGAYKCGCFSKNPVSIFPVDEYYDLKGDECFHYVDYGDTMSIKKVSLDKCD